MVSTMKFPSSFKGTLPDPNKPTETRNSKPKSIAQTPGSPSSSSNGSDSQRGVRKHSQSVPSFKPNDISPAAFPLRNSTSKDAGQTRRPQVQDVASSSSAQATSCTKAPTFKLPTWMQPVQDSPHFVEVIAKTLVFTAHRSDEETISEIKKHPEMFYFSTDLQDRYNENASGFGPVSLLNILRFRDLLRDLQKKVRDKTLVYYCSDEAGCKANTALLLACYVMFERECSAEEALRPFVGSGGAEDVCLTDVGGEGRGFEVTLRECVGAMEQGVRHAWFDACPLDDEELDRPAAADAALLHPVTRTLIAAPAAPAALGCQGLVAELRAAGVTTVVRVGLGDAEGGEALRRAGLRVHEVRAGGGAGPEEGQVRGFVSGVEGASGKVAVQSGEGSGSTGLLGAMWLMHRYKVTAAEAAAWVCLCRPGLTVGAHRRLLAPRPRPPAVNLLVDAERAGSGSGNGSGLGSVRASGSRAGSGGASPIPGSPTSILKGSVKNLMVTGGMPSTVRGSQRRVSIIEDVPVDSPGPSSSSSPKAGVFKLHRRVSFDS